MTQTRNDTHQTKKSIISELEKEDRILNKKSIEKGTGKFDAIIFECLPKLLKTGVDTLVDQAEKEIYLLGSLGVISGILPNVFGIYDSKKVYPNLYVAIIGKFGSGKGALTHCEIIGQRIHKALQKGNNKQLLFIPANNSKTGVLELLDKNGGKGIIFETESSTLSAAMKSEHGKFKDVLLKCFHHEPSSFYRSTEKNYVFLENPQLSCVVSSTPGQFKDLIPNMEDGLYSRFIYYYTSFDESKVGFRNVFDKRKAGYIGKFEKIAEAFEKIHTHLVDAEKPIEVRLKQAHQKAFVKFFDKWTKYFYKHIDEDVYTAVYRLALITFRIMMILSVLRFFDKQNGKKKIILKNIEIENIDFDNALEIVDILFAGSIEMYDNVSYSRKKKQIKPTNLNEIKKENDKNKTEIEAIEKLLKEGLGAKEIYMKLRMSKSKYNRLKKLVKKEEKGVEPKK